MLKIYSDFLFNEFGEIEKNAGILISESGEIVGILKEGQFNTKDFFYYPGLLTPGFVNAHCHLELSHMKGKVDTGTGLIPFLKSVVSFRNVDQNIIDEAIIKADQEMFLNGIVAVGDISNKTDTIAVKSKSKIQYYNFIEFFDFMEDNMTDQFFEQYHSVYETFGTLRKSMVPHASYSVSKKLFKKIIASNSGLVVSIHNQEIIDEDELFNTFGGKFPEFFRSFGFLFSTFEPLGKSAIHYAIQQMVSSLNTLFVHNTFSSKNDFTAALEWNQNSFFVTCPNANLYIENRLPNYEMWKSFSKNICIGTDSLCSNWSLDILSEIRTILKYKSYLDLKEILSWATINGARALRLDDALGSITIGKNPGINWIQDVKFQESLQLGENAKVKKLV
ncbi:MAG: amidohydrolase family protein [Saprospiraceae bacterium]|nr:amidohydrolase family protein [Saprospiraceae bacterium]